MDNKTLDVLLKSSLTKLGFQSYGAKLFCLDCCDNIVILKQMTYNGVAELYLSVIIKQCHTEVTKITKSVITDRMLIDTYDYNRLTYRTPEGYRYDLYHIPPSEFDSKIKEVYEDLIHPFTNSFAQGIAGYNRYVAENHSNHAMNLFVDSAQQVGMPELAGEHGHDWFLSDRFILLYDYEVDCRYVNANTERYIMENVIANIPAELKGKARTKWCNDQCKELFLKKGKRFTLGHGILFPFVNGKPLKYCGCNIMPPNNYQIYYNEDTGETFHYKRVKRQDDSGEYTFEIVKVE